MEAGKAMTKGADVLMLGKIPNELIVLGFEFRWPPRIVFHLTCLSKGYPCRG